MDALRWLDRLDVAGVEPLGLAVGFGWRVTYSHLERLAAAGLAERVYDRDGTVAVITRPGRRRVGSDRGEVRRSFVVGDSRAHARAVSWLAALVTLRGREWVSDREMRELPDWRMPVIWGEARGTHRPDLGVGVDGRRVAVEVELSCKAPRRLRAILAGYEREISAGRLSGGVLYVSDRPDVLVAVTRAARRVGLPPDRFRTRALEDVQSEVRALAAGRGGRVLAV